MFHIKSSSLGELSYLKVWHDNAGKSPSWFLKFVIVHDLQTREKFYFLFNDWIAADTEMEKVLPVATNVQKSDLKYLIEKETKEKMRDNHLWFSLVARPTQSSFSRTDRLTCCLVLLYMTMLMNIMYYEMDKSSSTNSVTLYVGPLSLSSSQVKL